MKQNRHQKIVEIVSKYRVQTQEELISYLNDSGFQVTQATVSRDIRELSLSKVSQNGAYYYALPKTEGDSSEDKYRKMLKDSITEVNYAQNIVVVKTYPGMANAAAAALDGAKHDEIVGTLAGDDTIFIVVRDTETARAFSESLQFQSPELAR